MAEVDKASVGEASLKGFRIHGPLKWLQPSGKWTNRYFDLNDRYLKMYEVSWSTLCSCRC